MLGSALTASQHETNLNGRQQVADSTLLCHNRGGRTQERHKVHADHGSFCGACAGMSDCSICVTRACHIPALCMLSR